MNIILHDLEILATFALIALLATHDSIYGVLMFIVVLAITAREIVKLVRGGK